MSAFGVDAVLLDPRCAGPLYRRSVRVSLGHVLRVPWARTGPLAEAVPHLHDEGLAVLGLSPAGELVEHAALDVVPGFGFDGSREHAAGAALDLGD
ncbi:TrmH family RNA methyltransferase, partial [Rothia endophytica]|uniref:TrmH family RNA methyltransferase n=1 Tax=Rothia endophytica TaxID=1324766 RepID=UPI003CD0C150